MAMIFQFRRAPEPPPKTKNQEETLLGNHRRYVRLWEEADRLGITPPVRTASQIVAEADGFPEGTPPLPHSLSPYTSTPEQGGISPRPGKGRSR